jgi:prevent-host-death family protein
MKTLPLSEAKSHFSSILKDVEAGSEIAITYGKQKKITAVIVSYKKWKDNRKRKLGTLEGKMSVEFADDFKITDEELINL